MSCELRTLRHLCPDAHLADLETLDPGQWRRPGRHEAAGDLTVELYEAHVAAKTSTISRRSPAWRGEMARLTGHQEGNASCYHHQRTASSRTT
jgi:hypothetical protein